MKGGATLDRLRESGKFAVSVLGTGQKDMAFAFFKHVERGNGMLGGYAYETQSTGAPVLVDAPAWFERELEQELDIGDHSIVVGRVVEAGVRKKTDVLTLKECGVNYGG